MFKLVIQDDEGKTTVVPLIRDEITIGRKEGNTIRLTERNVSRRHARILRNNGEVHIEDLGSYNGIRVNNARIAERVSLRVSDQVQIGDYKLYLKAEGLEQVSDTQVSAAQTDHSDTQSPTQTMPTVPAPAVTAPQPVQAAAAAPAGALPASAKHLATGDTDPSGRPIIAASAVSALSETTGYGKLVVLSSNFAGKEFELSRPQMIVGRTDENDIVINHRSISRNHAKLVREPDTGSYTISDLQSSNGVRVNGQDYGKVELRRGDVVDLGHVRLRFVEPGEDFVFARDAVITDVPESGGKRGVVFAILAAIVLIGAGIAVYLTMLQGDQPKDDVVAPGPGTNSLLTIDAGEAAVAAVDPATERPEVVIDAAAQVAVSPPVTTTKPPPDDDSNKVQKNKCAEHMAAQEWQQLFDCAKALEKLGGKDKAKEWAEIAMKEQKNELVMKEVRQLLRDRNLRDAQTALNKIGNESVYYVSLHEQFLKNENAALDVAQRRAQQYANAHDCASLRTQIRQLGASSTPRITAAISAIRCTDKQAAEPVAQRNPPPPPAGSAAVATGSGSAVTAPAPAVAKGPCETMNVDEVMEQASHQYGSGYAKAALAQVVKALACRQNVLMYRYAATYACAGRDLAQAKLYFAKVPPQFQSGIVQRCQQEGLDLRPQ